MTKQKVLIAVKTYPALSKKYTELVCTAGFREDGSWIRIYPSPFRLLKDDQKYKKYQWIELDLEKNPADPRPESYRPRDIDNISLGDYVPAGGAWEHRRQLILDKNKIYTNLEEIQLGAKNNDMSLVIFKPTRIKNFIVEPADREWQLDKKDAVEQALKQGSLFSDDDSNIKLVNKLPYKFSYQIEDDSGAESTMMIEDWEIGSLYWACLKNGDEDRAIEKVQDKYLAEFSKKDLHLFLGTTRRWHGVSANPYLVIGVFYPEPLIQHSLF